MPESAANALIERLSVATSSGTPDEVGLRRLELDAKELMRSAPAWGHVVLGGIASLRWQSEDMHDNFRVALQHLNEPTVHYNYSVSLSNVEQREAALLAVLEAQRRVPEDRFLLDHAIKLASRAAHFEEAKVLCATWRGLGGNAGHPLEQEIQSLVEAVAVGAFTEEGVRSVFAILGGVQAAERVHSARYVVLPDLEQPSAFLYEHYLHATSERAALVNERFVERVVARPELMDDPGLNFVVMPIGTG